MLILVELWNETDLRAVFSNFQFSNRYLFQTFSNPFSIAISLKICLHDRMPYSALSVSLQTKGSDANVASPSFASPPLVEMADSVWLSLLGVFKQNSWAKTHLRGLSIIKIHFLMKKVQERLKGKMKIVHESDWKRVRSRISISRFEEFGCEFCIVIGYQKGKDSKRHHSYSK